MFFLVCFLLCCLCFVNCSIVLVGLFLGFVLCCVLLVSSSLSRLFVVFVVVVVLCIG